MCEDTHVSYPDQIAELEEKVIELGGQVNSLKEIIKAQADREENLILRMNQALFFLDDSFQDEEFVKEKLKVKSVVGRVVATHGKSAKVLGDLQISGELDIEEDING